MSLLTIASASSSDAFVGVAFTESGLWVSSEACDNTAEAGLDSTLWFPVSQVLGKYTAEKDQFRGAFRYMAVVANTTVSVSVRGVHVKYTAAPTQDFRAYNGHFHSDDELTNRIWYAGVYTFRLCTIESPPGIV